ncbi:MAG: hypothetical protein R2681_00710 [Pyrinomonadaceae bacterium]
MNSSDKYDLILGWSRLVSMGMSLLLIGSAVFEISVALNILREENLERTGNWFSENWEKEIVGLGFLTTIAILFSIRFIILDFHKKFSIWISQLSWLIAWFTILGFKLSSAKLLFGSFFGSGFDPNIQYSDCIYYESFLMVSPQFVVIFLFYLFFSPLKELTLMIGSYITHKSTFA